MSPTPFTPTRSTAAGAGDSPGPDYMLEAVVACPMCEHSPAGPGKLHRWIRDYETRGGYGGNQGTSDVIDADTGLPGPSAQTYRAIADGARTIKVIGERTHRSAYTVQQQVERLLALGWIHMPAFGRYEPTHALERFTHD